MSITRVEQVFLGTLSSFMVILLTAGCTEETEEEVFRNDEFVTGFEWTACYEDIQPETGYDASEIANLECIAWEKQDDDQLVLEVYNLVSNCMYFDEGRWQLDARISDHNSLKLALAQTKPNPTACGNCAYDWRFVMEKIDWTRGLALDISIASCAQCDPYERRYSVPIHEIPRGIRCRKHKGYVDAGVTYGALHAPPTEDPSEVGECDEGLVLGTPASGTSRDVCLKPCTSDEECPEAGSYECDENQLCQLIEDLVEL
jgi:hypothetical protein